jgi:uncharacterized protein YkwD
MRARASLLIGCVMAAAACGSDGDAGGDDDGGDDSSGPVDGYCDAVDGWSSARAAAEDEVLELVNQHRAAGADCGSEGSFGPTDPLTMDPALRCAARVHTQDMAERDFFDHTNPDGEAPWDRMESAGYSWAGAGENIAGGSSTAADAVAQWMGSAGHCANIMSPDYVDIGVGYVDDARLWTQVFGVPSR